VIGARVRLVLVVRVMMMLASLPSSAALHVIVSHHRRRRLPFRQMESGLYSALDGRWAFLLICAWEEMVGGDDEMDAKPCLAFFFVAGGPAKTFVPAWSMRQPRAPSHRPLGLACMQGLLWMCVRVVSEWVSG